MIIVTTPDVPNKKIIKVHGIARGSTVRARNVGRDIFQLGPCPLTPLALQAFPVPGACFATEPLSVVLPYLATSLCMASRWGLGIWVVHALFR